MQIIGSLLVGLTSYDLESRGASHVLKELPQPLVHTPLAMQQAIGLCMAELLHILPMMLGSFWTCTIQIDGWEEVGRFYGICNRPVSHLLTCNCEAI